MGAAAPIQRTASAPADPEVPHAPRPRDARFGAASLPATPRPGYEPAVPVPVVERHDPGDRRVRLADDGRGSPGLIDQPGERLLRLAEIDDLRHLCPPLDSAM